MKQTLRTKASRHYLNDKQFRLHVRKSRLTRESNNNKEENAKKEKTHF